MHESFDMMQIGGLLVEALGVLLNRNLWSWVRENATGEIPFTLY
jgi:hypothetical protein